MNINYFLNIGIIFTLLSCMVEVEQASEVINEDYSVENESDSTLEDNGESSSSKNQKMWECGSEIIKVETPNGIKLIEIPISCDPLSDVYRGCQISDNVVNVEDINHQLNENNL